jgi:DNA invertase Pin-like site-specific DNA recombinase
VIEHSEAIGVNAAQQVPVGIDRGLADDVVVAGNIEGALYARVSSGMQEDGHSPDTQVAAMLATAQELGWRIRRNHVFREIHGGESVFDRPALTRLRRAAASGELGAVVFHHPDRFARSPVWIELIFTEMLHHQVRVAFVQGGAALSADTPEGYLLRYLSGYAAQTELEQHKERTARGTAARLGPRRWRVAGGRGPLYGYRFADLELRDSNGKVSKITPKARYIVDDQEAQVVRHVPVGFVRLDSARHHDRVDPPPHPASA